MDMVRARLCELVRIAVHAHPVTIIIGATALRASALGLRLNHRIFKLCAAIDVVDVVGAVMRVLNLLPTKRQLVVGALLQR